MNIIEAIKSGKRFRRKGFHSWCLSLTEKNNYHFAVEDILADDWEVEPKSITITWEQFDQVCQTLLSKFASDQIDVVCWSGLTKSERPLRFVFSDLAKALGL